MSNGFVFTQGLPQAGGQAPDAQSGLSDTILRAAALVESKKQEAQRQFERAQTMLRNDLNTLAGFDLSVAGTGQRADMLRQLSEQARQNLRNASNPVEAADIINNFQTTYNRFVEIENSVADSRENYNNIAKATANELVAFNSALPYNQEYVVPDRTAQINAEEKWNNPFNDYKVGDNGEILVQVEEGGDFVNVFEAQALLDTSMFDAQTKEVEGGDLNEWAKSTATKTDIGFKDGTWSESEAIRIFDTLIDDTETKSNKFDTGQYHRLQVLNSLKNDGKDIFNSDDKANFLAGNFDAIEPAKLNKVLDYGRNEFVRLSKFVTKDEQTQAVDDQQAQLDMLSNYGVDADGRPLGKLTIQETDTKGEVVDIALYTAKEPIKVEGTKYSDDGEYRVIGGGVNLNGDLIASVETTTDKIVYEVVDANKNVIATFSSQEEAEAYKNSKDDKDFLSVAMKEDTVTKTEEIVVSSSGSGVSKEVYAQILTQDPTLLNLMINEQTRINQSIVAARLKEAENKQSPSVLPIDNPDTPSFMLSEEAQEERRQRELNK